MDKYWEILEKTWNKVWPWAMLALIVYAIASAIMDPESMPSRCRYVPELDDYECYDPRG